MNTIHNYSVNAVKTFLGLNGHGYSCNLLFNQKKVAEVLCQADGGPIRFNWLDKNNVATVHKKNYKDEVIQHKGTVDEANFENMVMNLPKITQSGMADLTTNADIVVDNLVNDFKVIKKVKSDMKKTFTIQDKNGKILSWKITATMTVDLLKKFVQNKYPEAKFINDLPMAEVIDIYKKNGIIAYK